jgi:hypothetical protein
MPRAASISSTMRCRRIRGRNDQIANIFSRRPTKIPSPRFMPARLQAFTTWAEVTGDAMAA